MNDNVRVYLSIGSLLIVAGMITGFFFVDPPKENLRLLTPSRNSLNKHKNPKNNTSGFVGVYSIKGSKWGARLILYGKEYYGGSYSSKEEAIHARLKLELKYELTAD